MGFYRIFVELKFENMRAIAIRCILPVLVSVLLFSCKQEIKQANNIPNDVTYDSVFVSKIYHLENDSTKPSCSLKIKYIYPVKYKNEDVLSRMQGELNYALMEDEKYEKLSPVDAVNKYVEDYIENYKRDAETQFPDWQDSHDSEDYFSYYKTIESKILYDKGGLVSYQITSMDYKGGANSSTSYRNSVINLQTGGMLTEEDIFIADYEKVLDPIIVRKILEQNKVKKPEDLLELGYWGIEDLTANDNFWVNEKGITYIFNPGEYAAPSIGEISVFLTYIELDNILKKDSPISVLSGK